MQRLALLNFTHCVQLISFHCCTASGDIFAPIFSHNDGFYLKIGYN